MQKKIFYFIIIFNTEEERLRTLISIDEIFVYAHANQIYDVRNILGITNPVFSCKNVTIIIKFYLKKLKLI